MMIDDPACLTFVIDLCKRYTIPDMWEAIHMKWQYKHQRFFRNFLVLCNHMNLCEAIKFWSTLRLWLTCLKSLRFLYLSYCISFSLYLENKRRQFWFCCHMVSGIWSGASIFGVVDAGLAGIHYDTNMDRLTMTAKPKLSSFILFLMHLI